MRLLIVLLAGAAGLAAQVAQPDAAAVNLKQFEQNLEKAMRSAAASVSTTFPRPPKRVCAIPLLKVGPDASFKSNMPVIAPGPTVKFSPREVIPPGPVCDEQARK